MLTRDWSKNGGQVRQAGESSELRAEGPGKSRSLTPVRERRGWVRGDNAEAKEYARCGRRGMRDWKTPKVRAALVASSGKAPSFAKGSKGHHHNKLSSEGLRRHDAPRDSGAN